MQFFAQREEVDDLVDVHYLTADVALLFELFDVDRSLRLHRPRTAPAGCLQRLRRCAGGASSHGRVLRDPARSSVRRGKPAYFAATTVGRCPPNRGTRSSGIPKLLASRWRGAFVIQSDRLLS